MAITNIFMDLKKKIVIIMNEHTWNFRKLNL